MASRHDGQPPDPADVLSELLDLQGWSNRELGKRLAGDGATDKQQENQRIQVIAWRKGGRRRGGTDPSDESLERLAAIVKVPGYLLRLLYRHETRDDQLRAHVRDLARQLGVTLPAD